MRRNQISKKKLNGISRAKKYNTCNEYSPGSIRGILNTAEENNHWTWKCSNRNYVNQSTEKNDWKQQNISDLWDNIKR